jgi:hypothetical protein
MGSDQEQERQRVISKYKEYILNKPELLKLIPMGNQRLVKAPFLFLLTTCIQFPYILVF